MGLFGFDLVKEAGGWEAAMTEEEITEMEKKGYDMSSVRCKQAEIAAQEEAAEAAFMEQRKATAVPTDLNKLTSYRSTPRSTESEFFKDVASLARTSGVKSLPPPPCFTAQWCRPTAAFGSPAERTICPQSSCSLWIAPISTI